MIRQQKTILVVALILIANAALAQTIRIGSKIDAEGRILGEIMAQLLEDRGLQVERRFGLGATLICFEALTRGEIDLYPEYTGTLEQAILKAAPGLSFKALQLQLRDQHRLELLPPFGFNNTYALVVRRPDAERLDLQTIGDLAKAQNLRFGFSHEFLQRPDGWPGLVKAYGLRATPRGIEHGLIYKAIAEKELDVIDAYSTDANIKRYDLIILRDDKHFFPTYLAAPLARLDLAENAKQVLNELAGILNEEQMTELNAAATIERKPFSAIGHEFLQKRNLLGDENAAETANENRWRTLLGRTFTHVKLTAIALALAMLIAIPAGVIVYRVPVISKPILYLTGLLQTIPSIALLGFMIPIFGIGFKPAVVALFLYALLPILRNTAVALFSIDPLLKKVATGMGLTTWQRLRHVEMPLAAPTILAGIKTAAVISIGTATLAAFIGAGGLGEPIVTGLALNDTAIILEGAIPAAALAVVAEFAFEFLEKILVPRHLLQKEMASDRRP